MPQLSLSHVYPCNDVSLDLHLDFSYRGRDQIRFNTFIPMQTFKVQLRGSQLLLRAILHISNFLR